MQDYKCLCVAIVIYATLVNTQTHSFPPTALSLKTSKISDEKKS